MSDLSKTCPLSISLPQRWRSDGTFPANDRNDDGSFPGNLNEYTRQDDDVLSLLQRWKSDGSFIINDWSDDGSFSGSIKEYPRQDDVTRKNTSSAPAGLWKTTGSLQGQRSPRRKSKKAKSSQPLRWRLLCCSTRARSDSNDGTTYTFLEDETPLLDWSALSNGRWSEDWSCEY
jgi:hypothetical protein